MLDPLSKNTQCHGFNARHCLFASTSVNHGPWYLGNLRDPSAIFLLLDLDSESHDLRRSTKGDENSNLFIPILTKSCSQSAVIRKVFFLSKRSRHPPSRCYCVAGGY